MIQNSDFLQNSKWIPIIHDELLKSSAFGLAIINIDGEVLFANEGLRGIYESNPFDYILNPNLKLLIEENKSDLIFEGMLTFGSIYSLNNLTIISKIYRLDDDILIIGEHDIKSLITQNEVVSNLNKEISNLHRELIKEKSLLKRTLSEQAKNYNNQIPPKINSSQLLHMTYEVQLVEL